MAQSFDSDSEALDLDPVPQVSSNFCDVVDSMFSNPSSGASFFIEVPEFSGAAGFGDHEGSRNEGLRVTGLDSESDCEDGVPGFGIMNLADEDGVPGFGNMYLVDLAYEDGVPGFGIMNLIDSSSEYCNGMVPADDSDSDLGSRWDGLGSEDLRAPNDDEWEEVDESVDAEREELGALDVIEELSESFEISAEEEDHDPTLEAIRNLEWEILLAGINSERDYTFDPDADFDSYLAVHDDDQGDVYITNQETLFGQFEMDSASQGGPPAAKAVIENLPLVELRKEGLGECNVVCAVCKDDILPDEKVRKLPCHHYYHSDCILPWLSIRNTCPICRYELATDDAEYERMKAQRAVHGMVREAQVRFNSALFA